MTMTTNIQRWKYEVKYWPPKELPQTMFILHKYFSIDLESNIQVENAI